MNSKIEKTFNLPPLNEVLSEIEQTEEQETSTELVDSTNINSFLDINENQHENEVDDIQKKAIKAFEDTFELGKNVEPSRSARLLEVAGQFLKTGLDASNSKIDARIKAAKLKIEARRLKVDDEMMGEVRRGNEILVDRNEMIKQIIDESNGKVIDVDIEEDVDPTSS